jgi:glycosyltransferase involved in cell wall biosynthesis
MNPEPTVTVLVNTYNHERFIAQALSSVLEQDFPATKIETIVVDDGSTDRTSEIARSYVPRVRYIHKTNGGQVSAFHTGVAEARGQIVAFLDGDDWWAKNKISSVVAAFDSNPDISAVGHGYYEVDENGVVRARMIPDSDSLLSLETVDSARLSAPLRIFLGTSRLAIRRDALVRALPVPSELPFFDTYIFTQAIGISGARLLREPLCYYRLHSRNLYASKSNNKANQWIRYRLLRGLLRYLPPRLADLGVPPERSNALLDFDRVDADRLGLVLEGGKPWDTFRVELAAFRLSYREPDLSYKIFKYCTLMLTLLMPPKAFCNLREWYAAHGLRKIRESIGGATPAVPEVVRQPVEENKNSVNRGW